MRSLTDLRQLCRDNGILPGDSREACMDALLEKLGSFDPEIKIDPMKACDLKARIDWSAKDAETRFAGIAKEYLTGEYVADVKLDGARMMLHLGAEKNTMNTGRRSDVSYQYIQREDNFPHLRDAVVPELAGTILDGEMMPPKNSITTSSGIVTEGSLNSIMALIGSAPEKAVAMQKREGDAYLIAFDVIAYQGESVAHLPFSERRKMLELICKRLEIAWEQSAEEFDFPKPTRNSANAPVHPVCQMEANAENIQLALAHGFEGVILKKLDSRYEAGKRPKTWAKVKRMSTGDFVIFGSTPGKGRNTGKVGSMKVAYYSGDDDHSVTDDQGVKHLGLVYCADVAGITDAYRTNLTAPDGTLRDEHLFRVIEVSAQGRSKNDRLRHPLWVRDREDKSAEQCEPACSIDLFEKV